MEHLHLVAKNEDLEVFVPLILAGGDEAKDAAQDEVEKGEQHPRILWSGRLRRESDFATPTGQFALCEYLKRSPTSHVAESTDQNIHTTHGSG
jgi:hypothetical protein